MSSFLVVVNTPEDWPLDVPGVRVVGAREYVTNPVWTEEEGAKVFNLCRSYRYQRIGYYVSLLAAARGHRPLPSVGTIQDLKSQSVIRVVSDELDELIQKSLGPIHSQEFTLSVYFGRNLAKRHDKLAAALYRQFEAPLLRATFAVNPKSERWALSSIGPISVNDVPDDHREFLLEVATQYFASRPRAARRKNPAAYDLAILVDPEEESPPSDERALKRFVRAAEATGFDVETITADDYGRLAEFDALFIRETTAVNHRTYRFAQRAAAEGLIVVDDPESIIKCTNKVFLAELLGQHDVPAPKTLIVHKGNRDDLHDRLGLPCVLKQPDSAFSQGVVKAETREQLEEEVERLLERSDLLVAQEYLPTDYDWRVGIFDGQPLYVCRYFMARGHWQIIKHEEGEEPQDGRCETLSVEMAPTKVVKTAVKAASLIGDGLYGVDLKEIDDKVIVIEVNDNPSIDSGYEDAVLKDELYLRVMRVFAGRIEQRRRKGLYG